MFYDARRCIHFAACVRGLPEVFEPTRRPWIRAWLAPPGALAEMVGRCPTGALHYRLSPGPEVAPDQPTTVIPLEDGPLALRGEPVIRTPAGEVRDTRAALCRCGASGNKPYCDGTHAKIGWKSGGPG